MNEGKVNKLRNITRVEDDDDDDDDDDDGWRKARKFFL
jgi:hypothetical protein